MTRYFDTPQLNLRNNALAYDKDYRYSMLSPRANVTHTEQLLFIVADL